MNLNGWDTVFVATTDVLNVALANSTARLIQTFSFSEQGFTISGRFGTWSIQPNGSGQLMNLQIAIASGTLAPPGAASIDLTGMTVTVQVSLQLLPAPGVPNGQALTFNFAQVGTPGSNVPGAVAPVAVNGQNRLTPLMSSALGQAIASCLVQNAAQMSFVLATINPAQATGTPWLAPAASAYTYLQPIGGAPGMLAILSVTTPRDISGLQRTVDQGLLGGTGNAGLAISAPLFMRNVFAPALAASLSTNVGHLTTNANGTITAAQPIPLKNVEKAGETYTPVLSSLSASISDTRISLACNGSCDMHMGVHMTFSVTSVLDVGINAAQHTMTFAVDGTPVFHKNVEIPWYDHLFDIFGGLAEIILQVCVAAISSELGTGITQLTAGAELVKQAPSLVAWAGGNGFNPTQGGLATAFYLRGTIA